MSKTNKDIIFNRDVLGQLGLGCASLGNLFHQVSDEEAGATVKAAIDAGIKYMDVAPHYGFGLAEKRLGEALERYDADENIIISTKVGRRLDPVPDGTDLTEMRQAFYSPEPYYSVFDYSYDSIMHSFEASKTRLRRDRIDILYVHDIGRFTHGEDHAQTYRNFMEGGYRALRELRDAGVVGAIGLGVNEWEVCEEALSDAPFDIILLAGRYTLLEQSALDSFLPLCAQKNTQLVIGGPYNSGILAKGVRGNGPHIYEYQDAPENIIKRVAAIEDICERYGVPLAAAALQFPLAHQQVSAVIPGMGSARRIQSTQALMSHSIDKAFWEELRASELIRPDAPIPT